eukprot:CAMPEP_0172166020 /NCGR_PEP_ID=MMETSP1050-20130122/8743_1 /TAXON_ID=233186 /ORGANISM="Cryptomonas curvata, Strain CCAP979/52" /LENGTH=173 /DNA_ID=CAMNT_0012836571 /DNA_START=104 /DNA_END=622 /DNA_ORIENTATION=+
MTVLNVVIESVKELKTKQRNFLQPKMAELSIINIISIVIVLLTCQIVPTRSSAIDDTLSFKSLVLGSLSSGQNASGRVSRNSCHNYYMNVTDMGYSLVIDLNTSSAELFLLVKASPILRHSADDEHNYANYYQFKKQGGHHGVVVTSEHLSPGRWYIGICNYVQDPPALFTDR